MAAARRTMKGLQKYFRTKRVERPDGDYIECKYKKGTQQIIFPDNQGQGIPGSTSVLVCLKMMDESILEKLYSINYTKDGYNIRYKGNTPALVYGEIKILGNRAIVQKPEPIMRKIRKQTGELHIQGIPMEIPIEIVVEWAEKKFGIKVENYRLGKVNGFEIFNETRILETERSKLKTIKRACFLHGFLITTWYKGCIYDRKCNKCGKVGHTPRKCTREENRIINETTQEGETNQATETTTEEYTTENTEEERNNLQVTTTEQKEKMKQKQEKMTENTEAREQEERNNLQVTTTEQKGEQQKQQQQQQARKKKKKKRASASAIKAQEEVQLKNTNENPKDQVQQTQAKKKQQQQQQQQREEQEQKTEKQPKKKRKLKGNSQEEIKKQEQIIQRPEQPQYVLFNETTLEEQDSFLYDQEDIEERSLSEMERDGKEMRDYMEGLDTVTEEKRKEIRRRIRRAERKEQKERQYDLHSDECC